MPPRLLNTRPPIMALRTGYRALSTHDRPLNRRTLHSSEARTNTAVPMPSTPQTQTQTQPQTPSPDPEMRAPLATLPLSMVLRSLFTSTISSSPILLPPSLLLMKFLARTPPATPLLDPDRNPVLKAVLKATFYKQFCAGETSAEVRATIARLRGIGFSGVILGYAREVVLTEAQKREVDRLTPGMETEEAIRDEVLPWMEGTLETVRLVERGHHVSVKFTGAGSLALNQLSHRLSPSPTLHHAIDSICQLAHARGVSLLFDAEQHVLQDGIDDWMLLFARKYNTVPDRPTVHGTYQAYKKCTPAVLAQHLALAKDGGFTLGVKLVRGAYLGSDPRELFHDTKAETDACYDAIAASVLTKQWNDVVPGPEGEAYPSVALVLATHNAESVQRAKEIYDAGGARAPIEFAQLQGMADEISCELVEASRSQAKGGMEKEKVDLPVFKYLVWGSTGECMKYLLRRAQENKDAVTRTRAGRDAMAGEILRRCRAFVGLA